MRASIQFMGTQPSSRQHQRLHLLFYAACGVLITNILILPFTSINFCCILHEMRKLCVKYHLNMQRNAQSLQYINKPIIYLKVARLWLHPDQRIEKALLSHT